MLETLDFIIHIGSTPTFSYFDLYLYSTYAAHYVYFNNKMSSSGFYLWQISLDTDEAYGNVLSSIKDSTCGIRRQVSNKNNLIGEMETKKKMIEQLDEQLKVKILI